MWRRGRRERDGGEDEEREETQAGGEDDEREEERGGVESEYLLGEYLARGGWERLERTLGKYVERQEGVESARGEGGEKREEEGGEGVFFFDSLECFL